MAYKYQFLQDMNTAKLENLDLDPRFIQSFVVELTYKQALVYEAIDAETHGNGEKARESHKEAEKRTTFLLGMISALYALTDLSKERHSFLVDLAYGRA